MEFFNGLYPVFSVLEAILAHLYAILNTPLESKTALLESENAPLESETAPLESKNASLESETAPLESKNAFAGASLYLVPIIIEIYNSETAQLNYKNTFDSASL